LQLATQLLNHAIEHFLAFVLRSKFNASSFTLSAFTAFSFTAFSFTALSFTAFSPAAFYTWTVSFSRSIRFPRGIVLALRTTGRC
jgi:hypothetical protein